MKRDIFLSLPIFSMYVSLYLFFLHFSSLPLVCLSIYLSTSIVPGCLYCLGPGFIVAAPRSGKWNSFQLGIGSHSHFAWRKSIRWFNITEYTCKWTRTRLLRLFRNYYRKSRTWNYCRIFYLDMCIYFVFVQDFEMKLLRSRKSFMSVVNRLYRWMQNGKILSNDLSPARAFSYFSHFSLSFYGDFFLPFFFLELI